MTITLNLSLETAQRLREKAAAEGQTLEVYVQRLVEQATWEVSDNTGTDSAAYISPAEFDRRLDELSEGLPALPTLPADWSRADVYADHD